MDEVDDVSSADALPDSSDLNTTQQIGLWFEFIQQHYHGPLLENARKGDRFLVIDFPSIASFNPGMADALLDDPENMLKAASLAVEQFDLPGSNKGFVVRVRKLPNACRLLIRNIRSKDLAKLMWTEGIVRTKSEIRPQVTSAAFECPTCGNKLTMLQVDDKFKEPTRCSCGRKGKFRLASKELVDAQRIMLEEIPEQIEGGAQPKRMNVWLKKDLISPLSDRRTNPGSRLIITGNIVEEPLFHRSGAQLTRFELHIDGNWMEPVEQDFTDIKISKEEEVKIKEIAADPKMMRNLVASIAPGVYGHERIKEALVLQLVGGVRKVRKDGTVSRGDTHILLLGDPGAAKSMLLKRVYHVAPKARYVTGKSASGAGLTATVVKDEFLQGWSLEAGTLVLAHKGLACIDELDKMSKEDTSAMHEAMEQQTISLSKANIQAILHCETTILAAANPKYGRFDPYEMIAKQIDMPVTLITRFDLIFPIKDVPEEAKDEKMARFILQVHQSNVAQPPIETDMLRKYIAYAKQHVSPVLTDAAVDELKEYYVKMRSMGSKDGAKSVPITARQLEGLVRLSEAHARLRLSQKVQRKDARAAIDLVDFCLRQTAYDEKTGTYDIDKIATDMPASQRNRIIQLKELIGEIENKIGKTIPLEDVLRAAEEKGMSQEEVEEVLEKLKRAGDIYEPKRGFISRI